MTFRVILSWLKDMSLRNWKTEISFLKVILEISLSNLFLFNRRCILGSSRNQLRDIQAPPKSGMLYRAKGSCSIPIFTGWIKQWRWLFFAVNLATEEVKNWNLSMEDFKHLKDASVNSIWKWKYFINLFYLIYLRNVVTYDIPISLSYDWD